MEGFALRIAKKGKRLENPIDDTISHGYNISSYVNLFGKEDRFLANEIKRKYVTVAFLALNIAAYLLSTVFGEKVYESGSLSVLDVLENHEYYRIVTSMFLHSGVSHIVGNMLFVVILGDMLEQAIGHFPFALCYLLTGIGGNICSMLFELATGEYYHTVGASGAVCGIMGALLVLIILNRGNFGHISLNRMLLAIVYMIYTGLQSPIVNNAAHIGGLLSGILVMAVFAGFHRNRYRL